MSAPMLRWDSRASDSGREYQSLVLVRPMFKQIQDQFKT
ncbi:hypothetical protein NJ7G_2126 [Natrinema sp. J7-2]|nr:hypothetical protein NJ7G_2126 [Natrinema sp. J7-2]